MKKIKKSKSIIDETTINSSKIQENQQLSNELNKRIAYKSKHDISNFSKLSLLGTFLLFVIYASLCLFLVYYPLELSLYTVPMIYSSSILWIIMLGIFCGCSYTSFILIEKQGANKKTKITFLLLALSIVASVFFTNVLNLVWVALFISAISLFLSLVLVHELKKTNKKAYFIFLPCIVLCLYMTISYYVICMIN